jgi:hypothetical protein
MGYIIYYEREIVLLHFRDNLNLLLMRDSSFTPFERYSTVLRLLLHLRDNSFLNLRDSYSSRVPFFGTMFFRYSD